MGIGISNSISSSYVALKCAAHNAMMAMVYRIEPLLLDKRNVDGWTNLGLWAKPRSSSDPCMRCGGGGGGGGTTSCISSGCGGDAVREGYVEAARRLADVMGCALGLSRDDDVLDVGCGYGASLLVWRRGHDDTTGTNSGGNNCKGGLEREGEGTEDSALMSEHSDESPSSNCRRGFSAVRSVSALELQPICCREIMKKREDQIEKNKKEEKAFSSDDGAIRRNSGGNAAASLPIIANVYQQSIFDPPTASLTAQQQRLHHIDDDGDGNGEEQDGSTIRYNVALSIDATYHYALRDYLAAIEPWLVAPRLVGGENSGNSTKRQQRIGFHLIVWSDAVAQSGLVVGGNGTAGPSAITLEHATGNDGDITEGNERQHSSPGTASPSPSPSLHPCMGLSMAIGVAAVDDDHKAFQKVCRQLKMASIDPINILSEAEVRATLMERGWGTAATPEGQSMLGIHIVDMTEEVLGGYFNFVCGGAPAPSTAPRLQLSWWERLSLGYLKLWGTAKICGELAESGMVRYVQVTAGREER